MTKTKPHPTDGLKGLCIHFDGEFSNPNLSKITPYVFAFGGRIFHGLDGRVNCVVQGRKPKLTKKFLASMHELKIYDYDEFLDKFTLGGYI